MKARLIKKFFIIFVIIFFLTGFLPNLVFAWDIKVGVRQAGLEVDLVGNLGSEEVDSFCRYLSESLVGVGGDVWVDLSPFKLEMDLMPLWLRNTLIGKELIRADLQLKRDAMSLVKQTGVVDKLLQGHFESERSLLRVWVSADAVELWKDKGFLFINNAVLRVHCEFEGNRNLVAVEKKLTEKVNNSDKYRQLRKIFSALVLAKELKDNFEFLGQKLLFLWSLRRYQRQYLNLFTETEEVGGIYLSGYSKNYMPSKGALPSGCSELARAEILSNWALELVDLCNRCLPVIVSDMDQTLIVDDVISPRLAYLILDYLSLGGRFFVLTGADIKKVERFFFRPILKYAQETQRLDSLSNLFILTDTGMVAWSVDGTGLKKLYFYKIVDMLGQDAFRELLNILNEAWSTFKDEFNLYIVKNKNILVRDSSVVFCPWGYGFEKTEKQQLVKMLPNKDQIRKIMADWLNAKFKQRQLPLKAQVAGKLSIDINVEEGKAFGLKKIMEQWGISKDEILYIGDSFSEIGNDRSVLGWVAKAVNVGDPQTDVVNVAGGPSGTEQLLKVVNYLGQIYKRRFSENILKIKEVLNQGNIVSALKILSQLPEEQLELYLAKLESDFRIFVKSRAEEIDSLLNWAGSTGFALQPFSWGLASGGTSVRYLWHDVLKMIGNDDSAFYLVHNLDDGGSSLDMILRLERAGYGVLPPFGDAMNALSGFLDDWRYDVFLDSIRIKDKKLFREMLLNIILSLKRAKIKDVSWQDVLPLLYLMDYLESLDRGGIDLLSKENLSLRNAVLLSLFLKYRSSGLNLQSCLDSVSILLGLSNKRVSFANLRPAVLYIRRAGWTVRVRYKGKLYFFGIKQGPSGWKVVEYLANKTKVYNLEKQLQFLDGKLKISVKGGKIVINDKISIIQGGFDPQLSIDGRLIKVSRDGTGRPRSFEGSDKNAPIFREGDLSLNLIADTVVMQTNITEHFSPLPVVDIGLLDISTTKQPENVFSLCSTAKTLKRVEGEPVDFSFFPKDGVFIIGPGSFYTSILPFFMFENFVKGLIKARQSGVKVVLALGVGVDNETFGKSIEDLLFDIEKVSGKALEELVDIVIVPKEGDFRFDIASQEEGEGLTGPSISGKFIYGLLKFKDKSSVVRLERKGINLLPVKVVSKEVPSRVKGIYIRRFFYDKLDLSKKLGYLLNKKVSVLRDYSLMKQLHSELEALLVQIQRKQYMESGIRELYDLAGEVLSEKKEISQRSVIDDSEIMDIIEHQGYDELSKILYQNEDIKENIAPALARIKSFLGNKKLGRTDKLLVVAVVLEQFNLIKTGDSLIYLAFKNMVEAGKINKGLLLELAKVETYKVSASKSRKTSEVGGIIFFNR